MEIERVRGMSIKITKRETKGLNQMKRGSQSRTIKGERKTIFRAHEMESEGHACNEK